MKDLFRVYRQGEQEIRALDHVNLTISRGETVVVAGPSGPGKTALLSIAAGLDRPTEGSVWPGEHELNRMSRRELARLRLNEIGFVFQAYNLLPVLSAEENAEFILLLRGVGAAERRRRVRSLLKSVDMEGLEDRRPNQLSGGQPQRMAVGRATVAEPSLVLADEPTANPDTATAASLLDLMAHFNREYGTTFLSSTHDPRVMTRARRVIHLVDGRVDSDEPVREQG